MEKTNVTIKEFLEEVYDGSNHSFSWLEAEFKAVVESLRPGFTWNSDAQYKEVLALIPHAAYSLGAVRQMPLMIRGGTRRGWLHAL